MNTKMSATNQKTFKMVFTGLLSAISFVLFLFEFQVIPGIEHLKLDFSDIPALIGAIFFGPAMGVGVEFIKNIIEMSVKGIGTQMGFGNLMNFIVGCAYIVPFSIVFNKLSKKENASALKNTVISSVVGVISIIIIGIAGNYIIAPLFFKYFMGVVLPSKALWTAIWGATALNAVKGVMLSVVAYPSMVLLSSRLGSAFKINGINSDKKEIYKEAQE